MSRATCGLHPHARLAVLLACLLPLSQRTSQAQPQAPDINYDEAKVPAYTLPDPLVCRDGSRVDDAATWFSKRWPELLRLFETEVYGLVPDRTAGFHTLPIEEDRNALGGLATRRQVRLAFSEDDNGPGLDLLLYIPNNSPQPVPAVLGLNFGGNHTIHSDPAIRIPTSWVRGGRPDGSDGNRATEKGRGTAASRWPVEMILKRGYAVATAYYGDIDPDFDDGFKNGVHPLIDPNGVSPRPADACGSIGAWAWGLSRALDALASMEEIDAAKVVVHGHSRLGKTALWAGAQDSRFAVVVSNDSGEGGASLARRRFGETTERLNSAFPHWFCGNFKKYSGKEDELPVDQHELIALIAPRPVLVLSAAEDQWADPKGEFLAALGADPVYRLLGTDGLAAKEHPSVNEPILSTIGYHMRPGPHDITDVDWKVILDFADKHMAKPSRP